MRVSWQCCDSGPSLSIANGEDVTLPVSGALRSFVFMDIQVTVLAVLRFKILLPFECDFDPDSGARFG